jgi:hypothetical protein
MLDIQQIVQLLAEKKYIVLAALVIGFIVRLSKDDIERLPTVPARFRPLLAVALGALIAASQSVVAGIPLKQAAYEGVAAVTLAILGHVFGIEVARGGKELSLKGIARKLPSSDEAKALALGFSLSALLTMQPACALLTRQNAKTVLDAAQIACVMQSFLVDIKQLQQVCEVADELQPTLRELIAMRQASQRAGVKYGDQALGMSPVDAGAQ